MSHLFTFKKIKFYIQVKLFEYFYCNLRVALETQFNFEACPNFKTLSKFVIFLGYVAAGSAPANPYHKN